MAYTKAPTKEENEGIRREGENIKFIELRFKRLQGRKDDDKMLNAYCTNGSQFETDP